MVKIKELKNKKITNNKKTITENKKVKKSKEKEKIKNNKEKKETKNTTKKIIETNKTQKNEKKQKNTKEKNIIFTKRILILLTDYIIISTLSIKLLFYINNLIKTQKSYIEIFFYINIVGLIAFIYAIYFLNSYNSTPGMMLFKTKIKISEKNYKKNKYINILKYSLLYYSLFLSSIIIILEIISYIILKNTTMFEIISNTKLEEK